MADRNPPWYQHPPFPSIVGVLLDHGLLREGGTASLKLASRVAGASTRDVKDRQGAIVAALVREQLVRTGPVRPGQTTVAVSSHTWQVARDVLDVLVAHEAP